MPNFSSTRQRSAEGTSGASLLLPSRSVSELKDSLTGEHYCHRTPCAQGSAQIALHVMRWQKHSKSESRSQNLFDISKYCFAHHTHCSSGCYVAKLDHASDGRGKRLPISSASGSGGRITDAWLSNRLEKREEEPGARVPPTHQALWNTQWTGTITNQNRSSNFFWWHCFNLALPGL